MRIAIPDFALVVLVGASGSGKSTFARKHFLATEVLSSDYCRGLVSDDENNQAATTDAFEVLHFIAGKRLTARKLTVVDATNVQEEARKPLVELARKYDCLPVAIVLDLPEKICEQRNAVRPDRNFGSHVLQRQRTQLKRSLRSLQREGFRHVFVLTSQEDVDSVQIVREPLWTDKRHESGPFDIIGDIHGCFDELKALLEKLGYQVGDDFSVVAPPGRRAIFLGDLVDRGPRTPDVLRLVMSMVESGSALCVPGNHDTKLLKKLRGRDVRITHGLAETLEQLEKEPEEFKEKIARFVDKLVSHFVLDNGNLVVAHAGMKELYQGRASGRVREFALYGETTGETDEYGLPVRYNWAQDYRGNAMVVYGHTPVYEPEWVNRTICIDTGCVFGGKLTALRYPERELVSVPAAKTYYESAKPFLPEGDAAPASDDKRPDDVLDISDVLGKRIISTQFERNITVREENAIAALEVMSRFALSPKWLVYLPPTMSPSETSTREGYLEYPEDAFSYFQRSGVGTVVCEEKHMGSRAVVVLCRNEEAAVKRFKLNASDLDSRDTGDASQAAVGVCYTRTGRRFFNDAKLEREFIDTIGDALTRANFWDEFSSDWFVLDCELMPWSAKAQELVRDQYASVGAAAESALSQTMVALQQAAARGLSEVQPLIEQQHRRLESVQKYRRAYQQYCWPVTSIKDYKLAPFHLLASEKHVHTDKTHQWHMETLSRLAQASDGLLVATRNMTVDITEADSRNEACRWWEEMTATGGEGMVVKPNDFIVKGPKGLVQPAVKCRGPEYLRIIYGPEYSLPKNLERLRSRGLASKRSLAAREFALGIEAISRFVRQEPLYRVHECVFAVLALESEPVDPRL